MESNLSAIHNRLKKNLKVRKNLIKKATNSFRLYDRDLPQYPYIIDIYADCIVIFEKGKFIDPKDQELLLIREKHIAELYTAIKNLFKDIKVVFKERKKQSGNKQYTPENSRDLAFTVNEYDRKYLINPYDYLDCGLFLDHRPLRRTVSQLDLKNKQVLNLFSYTGSFSVAAAKAGGHTTSVDTSKKYLEWSKKNFLLNEIDLRNHQFIQEDVMKFLANLENVLFDLVIIDPPTFSNSKNRDYDFSVQENHLELIIIALNYLKKDGVIYFSNNFLGFKLDQELSDNYFVKDISLKTIPEDFRDKKIHKCFEIRKG